ncbi:peptidase C14 caspase catalytic subunit p20 [Candidatus Thiomargarita nelsonii]|uniref:Peptidase C14 caspase catalytic subunit p20 n=1 Tax=Candidatus Thiomargarita nelsonii TaxID=1003181 RepID=A0A176S5P9_9GAMM|nr:peptidase C14 caspase catalytic subunit p20 [Candidatus Thiomargarita nelsonii]
MVKQTLKWVFLIFFVAGCIPDPGGKSIFNSEMSEIREYGDSNSTLKALVIGNSFYEYQQLKNPMNDARAMSNQLVAMGFHVIRAMNVDYENMRKAVKKFGKHLSQTSYGSVGLLYFSGHGAQVAGRNFLIPTNNGKIWQAENLKTMAIDAQNTLAMMKENNKGMNFLILDACRDNPYKGSEKNVIRGLTRMKKPMGAFIGYATASGKTATDSPNDDHGIYTKYLLKALKTAQHKRIEDVFMEVENTVFKETNEEQEPWHEASLRMPFCFGGCL